MTSIEMKRKHKCASCIGHGITNFSPIISWVCHEDWGGNEDLCAMSKSDAPLSCRKPINGVKPRGKAKDEFIEHTVRNYFYKHQGSK